MSKIGENDIDRDDKNFFLVSGLMSRFELARSSVYEKLKKLFIKPLTREDGKKYITLEQLELLEELDTFLKEKRGDTKDFVRLCVETQKIILPEDETLTDNPEQPIVEEEPQIPEILSDENLPQANSLAKSTEQVPIPKQQLTILEEEDIEISPEASQQTIVQQLQVQKGLQAQAQDIQEVNQRARNRAFVKTVAEESLVAIYEATEDFTPEQKQQLAQHRAECDRARKSRSTAHNVNNFLSQALSGLTSLPNFNSNPSTSPSGASNNV